MDLLLNIISVAGPLALAAYVYTLDNISIGIKQGLWIVCAAIAIFDIGLILKDKKIKEEKLKREEFYNRLCERQELFDRNLPKSLTDNLERNTLLEKSFRDGQKYEGRYKFEEAIQAYKDCLNNSSTTEIGKIALHILIGNSYYFLSNFKEAEANFRESLRFSKKAEQRIENEPGKSIALDCLGSIFHSNGKPNEALEYFQQALEINTKLGYEEGIARNHNHIGTVYNNIGKYNEALKCHQQALEISKKIEYEPGIVSSLINIGAVYNDSGKPEEALKFFQEALEINEKLRYQEGIANVFNNIGLAQSNLKETTLALRHYRKALIINKRIRYNEGVATNLGNIGLVYITLGKSGEALKYYQQALEVYMQMKAQPRIEILLKIIKIIEEEKKEK